MAITRDGGSFRDPDGFVFYRDSLVYRRVTAGAAERLRQGEPFYRAACDQGLLVGFTPSSTERDGGTILNLERLPLVTYPYEWSFEQLRQAALLTLDVNLLALKFSFTLKDASAFNVQFLRGRPVFIDHLSFEPTTPDSPWIPYAQFCRHFLYPLMVGAYRDFHVGGLFQRSLDGLDQDLASWLLPLRARFRPSILMHLVLHRMYVKRARRRGRVTDAATGGMATGGQVRILQQLRRFVAGLRSAQPESTWADYYQTCSYRDDALDRKKQIVRTCFSSSGGQTVWDLGGNDGTFSRLIAPHVGMVVSLDLDHNAIQSSFVANQREGITNVYPLVYDVTSPSAALGVGNEERPTLERRAPADAILALALIHHLAIGANMPFDLLARYFSERCHYLVLEWVGPDDEQVQRLLAQRTASYGWYQRREFLRAFGERFQLIGETAVSGTGRLICQFERRA